MTDQEITLTLLAETMLSLEALKADYVAAISKLTNESSEAIEKRLKQLTKVSADKINVRIKKFPDTSQSDNNTQS